MSTALTQLLGIMAALRDPEGGCPWDRQQSFASLAPYTLEEAYEVVDTIEQGDAGALREELGDLLFQVVFHAQLGAEQGLFDFDDITAALCAKLIRRHPHVFGEARIDSAAAQAAAWEQHKAAERADKGDAQGGALDGVPTALPALTRACKLQRRAARVGFDWPEAAPVLDKLHEEIDELRAELERADPGRLEHELGDVLFACTNLARHLGVDPETALRAANRRFERRFRHLEKRLREQGREVSQCPPEELEKRWQEAKQAGDD
ncbi:MAG TPA: nucleoside triphosphate pyrophosphohydrolase [Gammaproteobacteria bacterium]|nr:nucleoside triphosphate pyrophosphohydrolase [Gammaproteobacteria bacterium]